MRCIKSNLERRVGGSRILAITDFFTSYLEPTGLAAARIAVLALSEQTIPALATDIVYYSIASWRIVLPFSSILSNSSMQQIPLSLKTIAPDSRTISRVSGSLLI